MTSTTDALAKAWGHTVETETPTDEKEDIPRTIHCTARKKTQSSRLSQQLTRDSAKVDRLPNRLLDDDGDALTWGDAADAYDHKLAGEFNNDDFQNTRENHALKQFGKLLYTDRRLREEYSNLHIGFFTLRGSPFDECGEWIPPLDFLEKLNESMSNLRHHWGKAVGDFEHEWCAVLSGSEDNAIPHWHYIFWVDGPIRPTAFESMLEAHETHSSVANEHVVEDFVRVARVNGERLEGIGSTELPEDARQLKAIGKEDRERGKVSPVARYVGSQIPHIAGASGKAFEHEHGATCWAYTSNTSRKLVRTSEGFGVESADARFSFKRFESAAELLTERRDWSFSK